MVASTQSLEDLGVSHPVNAADSTDRQPQQQQQQQLQERFGHAYRSSAQTAQDKRSRLSNVINNLRRKVPPDGAAVRGDSPRKDEDDRNSVERNLETLEKYVMTVLNVVGVIKEDEEEDKSKSVEKTELERRRKEGDDDDEEEEEEEEDPTSMAIKSEPSNEGDIEAAVVPPLEDSSSEHIRNIEFSETANYLDTRGMTTEEIIEDSRDEISSNAKKPSSRAEKEHSEVEEKEIAEGNQDASREKKEIRTLGTIIMDRLSEHQVEEKANVDDGRGKEGQRDESQTSEGADVGTICGRLVDDLLDNVYRTIDDQNQQKIQECEKTEVTEMTESPRVKETKNSSVISRELSMTSLHCSLPLDKVASVLQNCQTGGESVISRLSSGSSSNPSSTQKPKPSSIRHLCLYCDKKFSSISLRQRHTERLHQLCGGRRSERNPRKPSQNCQYCSDKCDTLEILFHHMVGSHGDRYHACVQCATRYSTREDLMMHMEVHSGNVERTGQVNILENQ